MYDGRTTDTWGHTHSANLTANEFDAQLALLEDALAKILGVHPAMYRPPYGEISGSNMDVLRARNYTSAVMWDDVAGPATGTSVEASNAMYRRRAGQYPVPHTVLNHEQDDVAVVDIIHRLSTPSMKQDTS